MSQIKAVVDTLKRVLKARGLTYADVARALGISEASVKRLFSAGMEAMTLARLEAVCVLVGMTLGELLHETEMAKTQIAHLTPEQEVEVVADLRLLLVAICARNGWRFQDIVREYVISEPECVRLLVRLDRLGLLELQPGNRIRLRVAKDFRWLPGGPIERFFERSVQREFLEGDFDSDPALRLYVSGPLSAGSVEGLRRRLHRLAVEFAELEAEDAAQPLSARQNVGLLVAMRPWELGAFQALRRSAPPAGREAPNRA